jgi:hypothetical protein
MQVSFEFCIFPCSAGDQPLLPWQVSWLGGGKLQPTASPSPIVKTEWYYEAAFLAHSGGTAPVLHRTSLLSPIGRRRNLIF